MTWKLNKMFSSSTNKSGGGHETVSPYIAAEPPDISKVPQVSNGITDRPLNKSESRSVIKQLGDFFKKKIMPRQVPKSIK
jgi:hypothetical protein